MGKMNSKGASAPGGSMNLKKGGFRPGRRDKKTAELLVGEVQPRNLFNDYLCS